MQLTKRVWAKNLRMALGLEPLEMHALMTQLIVLYEDLRIELKAASDFSDTSDEGNYRRTYFIRRTTGTLVEIEGALHRLNMSADFKALKRTWSTEHLNDWNNAVQAFAGWHQELRDLRNAFGGHFSYDAALYGIQNVHQDTVGFMRYELAEGKPKTTFLFAADIVATALGKDKGTQQYRDYIRSVFEHLLERFKHATHVIHLVQRYYLIFRFGEPPEQRR